MLKKFAFQIIPIQIFLFVFWFKNGFIDKVMGVLLGIITPDTAYAGDTWAGWKGYISLERGIRAKSVMHC